MPPLRGWNLLIPFYLFTRNSVLTHTLKPEFLGGTVAAALEALRHPKNSLLNESFSHFLTILPLSPVCGFCV